MKSKSNAPPTSLENSEDEDEALIDELWARLEICEEYALRILTICGEMRKIRQKD